MASIFFRTIIVYLLLSLSMKIMGKRQIGELDVSDLISTLLISEIAAIPIDDSDIPLMNAVIPILFIVCLEIIISAAKNRSNKIKRQIEGQPEFLIFKGNVLQSALKENRISINELLAELRISGCANIKDVEYCRLEANGKISFVESGSKSKRTAHSIIIDGARNKDEIELMNLSDAEISALVGSVAEKDIFLLTVDDQKRINIILKEKV